MTRRATKGQRFRCLLYLVGLPLILLVSWGYESGRALGSLLGETPWAVRTLWRCIVRGEGT